MNVLVCCGCLLNTLKLQKPNNLKKAIVIGAGIGGLASAIRLQAKGYQVSVFESNNYPGGKLTEIRNKDFRFDAGPSLFTMPEKVDELLGLLGAIKPSFEYERLDEVCRYFYEDGTQIKGWGDGDKFANEVELKLGVPKERVLKHLSKSKFIFNTTNKLFLEQSLHKFKTYFSLSTFYSFLKLPFLNINSSMNSVNKKTLGNDKLVQLFNRYATYNGSNPYVAPGILNIIPHLEFGRGAFFPKTGMHSITTNLFKKAKSLGVDFHFNAKVEVVKVKNRNVKSIIANGKQLEADLFVSNMDIVPFYKRLLPKEKQPEKVIAQERSSSALIFYWGIKKEFKDLILHNILFSDDYKKEFDYIFNKNNVCDDPTIYINISSKHKRTDAPDGCENWFVMINVPGDKGQDWDEIIKRSRQNIIDKIERILKVDVSNLIAFEDILDPRSIERKTSSYQGSLYGTSSNNKMAAFFRHPNFSKEINNLYFCGGSVHPGGGIPLALSSAKIVSELVD